MVSSLIYFVVTMILTIALAPRPPNAKAASISDFSLPTADQGRSIPVVFGTVDITGSNCVWYGDLRTDSIRQHSLFSSTVTGFNYYMGFHLVLGHGPFDSINKIRWDQKLTWRGNPSSGSVVPLSASGSACMDWLNLYGGNVGGQGGTRGCFNISMGGAGDTPDAYLMNKLGGVVPAYRGVVSAIWINAKVTNNFTQADFSIKNETALCGYIGTSPYIKAVAFEVTRILQGWNIAGGCWYPSKAVINHAQNFTNAPTWSPSFQAATNNTVASGAATMTFDNSVQNNFAVDTSGFIHIGTEWIRIVSMQTASVGGSVVLTGVMNVVRGMFGTTPASYAANTQYYVYLANVNSTLAMNAAHVVYQCLTDPRWGMGLDPALIDDVAFRAAADTFFTENMGLCMQWVNASTVEDFLKIVLNHCAASLVLVNATGKYQLVPIRGGYNAALLPIYDESSIKSMDEFTAQGWADEVNEVVLVYTDPSSVTDTAITGQDISNIDVQGKVVSTTVNYQGFRDHLLAADVLGRELSAHCTPLIKLKFSINRVAWATASGGLFKLNWAARNVAGLIFRVTQVAKGKIDDNTITIDAVQDIYSLGLYNYQIYTSAPKATPSVAPPPTPTNSGPTVISSLIATPPTAPSDGDKYVIPPGATGAWAGQAGMVALWDSPSNSWVFLPIPQGTLLYDNSTGKYLTSNGAGTTVDSGLSGSIAALNVTFDDSTAHLGTSTVQAAINVLAANLGSAINLLAYASVTTSWYGTTFDGSVYTSPDGLNWTVQNTLNQTSFSDLVWAPPLNNFFARRGNQIGHPTAVGVANIFGAWSYVTAAGPPSGSWSGLRWIPQLSKLVVFDKASIRVSADGVTWANPLTAVSYATVVTADAPYGWWRLGEGATIYSDSGSGANDARFSNGTGVPGSGFGTYTPVINTGAAEAFLNVTYVEPRTSANAPVNLITGTGPFTIELWIAKYKTTPTAAILLYAQPHLLPAGGYFNAVELQYDITTHKLTLRTAIPTTSGPVSWFTVGMALTATTGVDLFDGSGHHVVAVRDGAGAAQLYVDNALVGSGTGLVVDSIATDSLTAGSIFGNTFGYGSTNYSAVLDELALYRSALSATRVGVHYNAGISGLRTAFTIVDIVYDDTNGRTLIFGHYDDTSAGTDRFIPQVFTSPDGLQSMAFLANLSAVPATDNIKVNAVANRSPGEQLPAAQKYLFKFGTQNPAFGTSANILAYTFWYAPGNRWYGFENQGNPDIRVFDQNWNLVAGGSALSSSGFWISAVKLSNVVYAAYRDTAGTNNNWAVTRLDISTNTLGASFVGTGSPSSFWDISLTPAGALYTVGSDPATGGLVSINPTTMAGTAVGGTGRGTTIYKFTSDNTNVYALSGQPTASQFEVITLSTGATAGTHALDATDLGTSTANQGATDVLLVGAYLYVYCWNAGGTGGGKLVRYNASTFAKDTGFGPYTGFVSAPLLVGGRKVLFADGLFLQVGSPTEAVLDLTNPAAPAVYRSSILGVAMTKQAPVAQYLAKSITSGTTWTWPSLAFPTQTPPHGLDCLVWDGSEFMVSGQGWSAVSGDLVSWSISGGASGIPATYNFLGLYPNLLGTTGAAAAIVGAGAAGLAFSGTLAATTQGMVWTLGPKVKATAAAVSYNPAGTDLPATDVQSAITLLSGSWDIIKQQIFGG